MQQLSWKPVGIGILLWVLGLALVLGPISCSNGSGSDEYNIDDEQWELATLAANLEEVLRIEALRRELSGTKYAPGDTLDEVHGSARLVLSYDSTAHAFTGTVENTTETMLPNLSVVVYLDSHESKLSTTPLVDLAPSQVIEVTLPTGSKLFTSWSAEVPYR